MSWRAKLHMLQNPPHRGLGYAIDGLLKIDVWTIRRGHIMQF